MKVDIAIVGYGPVGATLAALLGGHGLKVAVIERSEHVYDKPRALTADHEMMRTMQFAGIGEAFGRHVRPHGGTQFLGVDGGVIRDVDAAPPPYPLGWPTAIHFVQPEFETMLRTAVDRHPDVHILLSHELIGFEDDGETVWLGVRDLKQDRDVRIEARYLLACDGASSPVRKALWIAFDDFEFDEPWLVVDAWLRRETPLPEHSTQYCWPWRPGTLVHAPGDLRRWEIKILPDEQPSDFQDPARIREVLKAFVDVDAIEIWRSAVYRFHAIVAQEWRRGRVFLVGDAVHQTPPFMAQGLCSGVRDAMNLAWKLLLVEAGRADACLLETYEAERKPHAQKVIALAKQRGKIIGELDLVAAKLRDIRLREQRARGEVERFRHREIPPLTDGLIATSPGGEPAPAAGTLFPQPWVDGPDGRPILMDDLLPMNFLLVVGDPDRLSWLDGEGEAVLQRLDARQVAIASGADAAKGTGAAPYLQLRETSTLFADWAAEHHACATLVRPDRYVYGVAASREDLIRLTHALSKALNPPG